MSGAKTFLGEKLNIFCRNDDDREINHHGRPVEVGEQSSRPGSSMSKVCFQIDPKIQYMQEYLIMPTLKYF